MKLSNEAKVGGLVVGTAFLAVLFAWVIGIENPFRQTVDFYVTYNFAGGVEVGSPVRVSGIKVGKVKNIDFFVPSDGQVVGLKEPGSADRDPKAEVVPVRLKVSVLRRAAVGVRQDSKFYINLAGIIGERYIEITPGTMDKPQIETGAVVAGVDPPRLDQLISQSFNVAGKIGDVIDENRDSLSEAIKLVYQLSKGLNTTVADVNSSKLFKSDFSKLIGNLIAITRDVRVISDKIDSPDGKKTVDLLYRLLWRLEPLDSQNIRAFLQKEGVKVSLF